MSSCPCNDPDVSEIWGAIVNGGIPLDFCVDGQILSLFDIRLVTTSGNPVAFSGEVEPGLLVCATPDGSAAPLTPAQDDFLPARARGRGRPMGRFMRPDLSLDRA